MKQQLNIIIVLLAGILGSIYGTPAWVTDAWNWIAGIQAYEWCVYGLAAFVAVVTIWALAREKEEGSTEP